MPTTWNAIFLGNSATEIDPSEGDNVAENAGLLVGQSYGTAGDPLANHVVSVATADLGGNAGALDTDQFTSSDEVTYDLGGGSQTAVMDGVGAYNATITYMDGSSTTITAVLFQDSTGNLFLAPQVTANADAAAMEAMGIRTLSLDSMITNDASLSQDRYLTAFPCFAPGTRISTPRGDVPVEQLGAGDLVNTMDSGPQRIVWSGSRALELSGEGAKKQRPIEFKPGSLGIGLPMRRLVLSPQHRLFIRRSGEERLAPAKAMTSLRGVRVMQGRRRVTYHTLLLERHGILFAEGLPVESFFPGPMGLASLPAYQCLHILARFPQIFHNAEEGYGPPARPFLTVRQAEAWVADKADFAASAS